MKTLSQKMIHLWSQGMGRFLRRAPSLQKTTPSEEKKSRIVILSPLVRSGPVVASGEEDYFYADEI